MIKQLLKQILSNFQYHTRILLSIAALVLATQLVMAPAHATGVYQMPSLSAGERTWVFDEDDAISRLNEGRISNALEKLADQTGKEVRFVTIHRLDYGETIESFTDKLFEKWFPTPEAQANQALLVLDTVTNTSAIHTGDKVKSLLSDEIAQSVASETLLVPLQQGNKYNQAFLDASERLVAVLSGQPDPGAPIVQDTINVEGTFTKAEDTNTGNATVVVVVLLIAATVIPMVTYFWYQGF